MINNRTNKNSHETMKIQSIALLTIAFIFALSGNGTHAYAANTLRTKVSTQQDKTSNLFSSQIQITIDKGTSKNSLNTQSEQALDDTRNNIPTDLKGEVQEFGQNAFLWQQLNTRLIRGKCQLTPIVPQTIRATVNKENIFGAINNNQAVLGVERSRTPLAILKLRAQTGGPILTLHREPINNAVVQTSAQLAECIPAPTDSQGRNQWDLLEKELHDPYLRESWDQWTNNLCMFLFNHWAQPSALYGHISFHLTIYSNGQTNIKIQWSHSDNRSHSDDDNKDFNENAKSVMNCLAGSLISRFPSNSQVQQIHLQIILEKGVMTAEWQKLFRTTR